MVKKINVGIYGDTGAGKTAFLLRFLNELKRAYGNEEFSQNCSHHVPNFLDSSNSHTLSGTPELWVRFQNDFSNGNGSPRILSSHLSRCTKIKLIFKDLRGEDLRKNLDDIASSNDNIILKQIEECDVYLFMLDPTGLSGKELPANFKLDTDLLNKEMKRAQFLIQKIIEKRGNKNLPILFVQTHKDMIDQLDENDQKRLADWFVEANRILRTEYRPLENMEPESLTNLEKTSWQISSTTDHFNDTQIIPCIGSLLDLVNEYRIHSGSDRQKTLCVILLILLMGIAVFFGISALNKREIKQELSRPSPISKEEQEIRWQMNQLKKLTDQLKSPDSFSDDFFPRKTMKKAWNFIDQENRNSAVANSNIFRNLIKEFQKTGKEIEKIILNNKIDSDRRMKFAELLTGLYSERANTITTNQYFNMAEIANTTKNMIEDQLIGKMRQAVKRHTNMQSVPEDLIQDLCIILNETKDQIGKLEISDFGRQDEITLSVLFLRGRIKERKYPVKMNVSGSARSKETITFEFAKQTEKNALTLYNQTTIKANPNGFFDLNVPKNASLFTIPLSHKVPDWKVTRWDTTKENWSELYRSNSGTFLSDTTPTLASLGMPLLFKEKVLFTFDFTKSDKEEKIAQLNFQFQNNASIPDLLWDAVFEENKDAKKNAN